jgi:hypothetical protein
MKGPRKGSDDDAPVSAPRRCAGADRMVYEADRPPKLLARIRSSSVPTKSSEWQS